MAGDHGRDVANHYKAIYRKLLNGGYDPVAINGELEREKLIAKGKCPLFIRTYTQPVLGLRRHPLMHQLKRLFSRDPRIAWCRRGHGLDLHKPRRSHGETKKGTQT